MKNKKHSFVLLALLVAFLLLLFALAPAFIQPQRQSSGVAAAKTLDPLVAGHPAVAPDLSVAVAPEIAADRSPDAASPCVPANLTTSSPSADASAQSEQPVSSAATQLQGKQAGPDYAVQDAGMSRNFVLALNEIWVTDREGRGRVVSVDAASPQEVEQLLLASSASGNPAQAVLYEEGADRNEYTRRIVLPLVTVRLSQDSNPAEIARSVGASSFELPAYAPGFAVLRAGDGLASLRAAKQLVGQSGVLLAEAQLARQHSKRAMPNDPFVPKQWHLKFASQSGAISGTDVNIDSAWSYPTAGAGRRGRGIYVGIVDDGLETAHPDLAGNVDTAVDKDWNGNDADPNPGTGDDHGTACAGNVAAVGNNGVGVSGTAPDAKLVGMRLISGVVSDSVEAEAMTYRSTGAAPIIHILSNSWGPNDDGMTLEGPGPLALAALKTAAETGRGGKGSIITWAGGNGLDVNDNSNYDGYANSIYTIAVGALDSQSRQAWYSEPGANLVICAPSSGDTPALGITTVDRSGAVGYNSGTTAGEISGQPNYTQTFGGTSSATPTVSGIIALMLEANPNLGWRDVQEILIRTAKKANPSDTDWKTPVAPDNLNHNHKFGAGLIDATAAVTMAASWANLSTQLKRTVSQAGLNVAIPNNNTTGITRDFVVNTTDNIRVEHATLTVNINHTARGNLKITLTSPYGTVSRLAEVHSDTGDNFANWTFMTVRNWGESAAGTWKLKITDESGSGNTTGGTLTAAALNLFGSASTTPPPPTPTPTPTPAPTPTPTPVPVPVTLVASGDLTFGQVALGRSAIKRVTLRNSSASPARVDSLVASDPVITTDWSGPRTIPARGAVQIAVKFAPAADLVYSGELVVNAGGSSAAFFPFSGTGLRTKR